MYAPCVFYSADNNISRDFKRARFRVTCWHLRAISLDFARFRVISRDFAVPKATVFVGWHPEQVHPAPPPVMHRPVWASAGDIKPSIILNILINYRLRVARRSASGWQLARWPAQHALSEPAKRAAIKPYAIQAGLASA